MSAVRSFQMASKQEIEEDRAQYEVLEYEFKSGDDGKRRTVAFSFPGTGSFSILISSLGAEVDEGTMLANVLGFVHDSVEVSDYRFILTKVRTEEISLAMLMEIVKDATEAWSTFPTQSPSASTSSPRRTGTRSTGRAPGAGSTRSA